MFTHPLFITLIIVVIVGHVIGIVWWVLKLLKSDPDQSKDN